MFGLTDKQKEDAAAFIEEQDAKVVEMQKDSERAKLGLTPYYGASGGAYSYIFTPTSLGLCVAIRNNLTKDEKSLTDTSDW